VWGAVGSHFVDALRYLDYDIEGVQCMLATIIDERSGRRVTSDDFAAVHLRLKRGVPATMTFSAVASGPDEPTTFTIHGETGAFRLMGEELLFAKPREPFRRIAGDDLSNRPGNSPGGAFGTGTYCLGVALRRALDEGDRSALAPAATFEDGLMQQLALDAGRRSEVNRGRWEAV
jgi:predicted dehydrogenase